MSTSAYVTPVGQLEIDPKKGPKHPSSLVSVVVRPHDEFPVVIEGRQLTDAVIAIDRDITWAYSTKLPLVLKGVNKLRELVLAQNANSTIEGINESLPSSNADEGNVREQVWTITKRLFPTREWVELTALHLPFEQFASNAHDSPEDDELVQAHRAYLSWGWNTQRPAWWDGRWYERGSDSRREQQACSYFRDLPIDPAAIIGQISSAGPPAPGPDMTEAEFQAYWAAVLFGILYFLKITARDDMARAIKALDPDGRAVFVAHITDVVRCGGIHLIENGIRDSGLGWQELIDFCNGSDPRL